MGRISSEVEQEQNQALLSEQLEEVLESTGVEESFRCTAPNSEGEDVPCVLAARLSSETGEVVWEQHEEVPFLIRTIQMGQMCSMLKDSDRNEVYFQALRKVVQAFVDATGRKPVVLDIGCGTGLLSCMAGAAGAAGVVGCEMFDAMATIAEGVVNRNGLDSTVQIVASKSCDLQLDSERKCDIIVSELLDSALLGESVVFSHGDSITRLLARDETLPPVEDRVLPHSAGVFATLVECRELLDMHVVNSFCFGKPAVGTPFRNEDAHSCQGGRSLLPVHWREMKQRGAGGRELCSPMQILELEFFHDSDEIEEQSKVGYESDIVAESDGLVHGILLSWTLNLLSPQLDPARSLQYSTAPDVQNWQDHWVQVIYPLPTPIACKKGDVIIITAFHDNLRIWLECSIHTDAVTGEDRGVKRTRTELRKMYPQTVPEELERFSHPECQCGWHLIDSPFRLCALNDVKRRTLWESAVKELVEIAYGKRMTTSELDGIPPGVILDVSDESVLALTAALRLKDLQSENPTRVPLRVVSQEKKLVSLLHYRQLAVANDINDDLLEVCESGVEALKELDSAVLAGIVCENFFFQLQARPTWAALSFFYQRRALQCHCDAHTLVVPCAAKIMAVALELDDLRQAAHGKAGIVCGFDHEPFDEVLEGWNTHWFPYKLADYRKKILSQPTCIAVCNYGNYGQNANVQVEDYKELKMIVDGRIDCLAIYVDFCLGPRFGTIDMLDAAYMKHNVRFITGPKSVKAGDTLVCKSRWSDGDSDIELVFDVL